MKSGEGFFVTEIFKGKKLQHTFNIIGKRADDPLRSYYKEFMDKIDAYLKSPAGTF